MHLGLSSVRGEFTTPFEKVGVDDSTMALPEDGAAEIFRSAVRRLSFLACDRPDVQSSEEEAARGSAADSSSALSAPMCSLIDPCSNFDVTMVRTAVARRDRHKRRHRPGSMPVDKMVDFRTHCTVWSTLVVDFLHDTCAGQPQQW